MEMALSNGFSEITESEMQNVEGGRGASNWFYDTGNAIGRGIANVQNAVSRYYANYDSAAFEKSITECAAMNGRKRY